MLRRLLSFDFWGLVGGEFFSENRNLIVDVAKNATLNLSVHLCFKWLKALNISFVEFFDNFYDRIIKGSVEKSRQPNVVENFQT